MKKDISVYERKFNKPVLYLDDLKKIENILLGLNSSGYKIEINQTAYDKLSDIDDVRVSKNFNLQTGSPYISLTLRWYGSRIYCPEKDLKIKGAVHEIVEIISKRERNFITYLQWIAFFAALIVGFIGPYFIKSFIVGLLIILGLDSLFVYLFFLVGPKVKFIANQEEGFLERNKDNLIVGIIVAIITIVLTHFIDKR